MQNELTNKQTNKQTEGNECDSLENSNDVWKIYSSFQAKEGTELREMPHSLYRKALVYFNII